MKYSRSSIEKYVRFLCKDIEQSLRQFNLEVDTIYFGGGTPSLLSVEQINLITSYFNLSSTTEITLEINPCQITEQYLNNLNSTSINRFSIGLQSMNDMYLKLLTRQHQAQTIPDKISLCREYGYNNISIDLIYGLPKTTVSDVEEEIEKYLALQPQHISTYLLTLEETKMIQWHDELPPDDVLSKQYHTICRKLTSAGFNHYEISNFAQAGYESKHNLHYWLGDNYLGLGASAAGWIRPYRYQYDSDLEHYYNCIDSNNGFSNLELCDQSTQKKDYIIMRLRLMEGLDLQDYQDRFNSDFTTEWSEQLHHLLEIGMVKIKKNKVSLTSQAWFVSNAILLSFF